MKKLLLIASFLLVFSFGGFAQTELDTIILPQMIINGDTMDEIILEPLLVTATKLEKVKLEEWQMRYLRKVYPYALRTARLSKKIDDDLKECKTNKARKRYLNECEKVMRANFESTLRNLTRIQGQYLIKLINRETGQTVYDLLKEYRSGWKAFWWNFAGKFFDLDMKEEYDPNGKDKEIENYIQRLQYIYHTDGTNYIIQNEQFNTPIPGQKRPK
ncbi:MAG: DUF4294 domain-containing protein [Chitinophagales bacterium]